MPEKDIKHLSEVIDHIKKVIDGDLGKRKFWIRAELSNINFHRSGHCYIDLVENADGRTLAQIRATIWKIRLREVRLELDEDFDHILKKGAEILCLGEVVFHAVYGLSINILAIDRSFALGELERKKQESLKKLEAQGLLERNRAVPLPTVIQRIAIVGSPGTSGHTDFLKMLEHNEHAYDFRTTDFACQVQGDHAAGEIIRRLKELMGSDYDVIVLIRGGGSKLDLEVFNAFELARAIALHDKPILTGIGHETDISVADIVANRHFKTPSAVGAFVVERALRFDVAVHDVYKTIRKTYEHFMRDQSHRVEQAAHQFESRSIKYTQLRRGELHKTANRINILASELLAEKSEALNLHQESLTVRARHMVGDESRRWKNAWELAAMGIYRGLGELDRELIHRKDLLVTAAGQLLRKEREDLLRKTQLTDVYHPARTLERGWALVRKEGQVVDKETKLLKGDELEIELHDRRLVATLVKETKKWKDLLTKALQKN